MSSRNQDAEDLQMAVGFVEACDNMDEQNMDLLSQSFRQLPDGEIRLSNALLTLSVSLAKRLAHKTGKSPYDEIRNSILREINEDD